MHEEKLNLELESGARQKAFRSQSEERAIEVTTERARQADSTAKTAQRHQEELEERDSMLATVRPPLYVSVASLRVSVTCLCASGTHLCVTVTNSCVTCTALHVTVTTYVAVASLCVLCTWLFAHRAYCLLLFSMDAGQCLLFSMYAGQ